MASDVAAETAAFLGTVLADKPQTQVALVWSVPRKRSLWAHDAAEATQHVQSILTTEEIYVGCGWAVEPLGETRRAKAHQISGVPGVWVDIDVQGPAHKKANLPATTEEALECIGAVCPPPTLSVHSGYGVHLWWLYEGGWDFHASGADAVDMERKQAAALSVAWQEYIRGIFAQRGWELDATADLARVLRVAGTWNHKVPNAPIAARILDVNETVHAPEDLRQWMKRYALSVPAVVGEVTAALAQRAPLPIVGPTPGGAQGFRLRADATIDNEKWLQLADTDPKIWLSWKRQRKDMKKQSPSEYDLSLASFAAHAGWSDQEIVDLCIECRRVHGDDLKLQRTAYWTMTLYKARQKVTKEAVRVAQQEERQATEDAAAVQQVESVTVQRIIEETEAGDDLRDLTDDERADVLAHVNTQFGMKPPITRVIQYQADPEVWYIEIRGERKKFGSVNDVMSQTKWRDFVGNNWRRRLPDFKKAAWGVLSDLILRAAIRETAGEEAKDRGRVLMWLTQYLESHRVVEDNDRDVAAWNEMPFRENTVMHIFGNNFRMWLRTNMLENITSKEMAIQLRNIGAQERVISVRREDQQGRTTKQSWQLPPLWETVRAVEDGDSEAISRNGTVHTGALVETI